MTGCSRPSSSLLVQSTRYSPTWSTPTAQSASLGHPAGVGDRAGAHQRAPAARWSGRSRARGSCRRPPGRAPGSTPSSSIATWAATVWTPWPISVQQWRTSTVPSSSKRTTAFVTSLKPLPEARVLEAEADADGPPGRHRGRRRPASPRRGSAGRPWLPPSMIWPGPHIGPGVDDVAGADLPAADAGLLGQPVEHALHRELGLVGAEAAERTARPGCSCGPPPPPRRSPGTWYGPVAWPAARSSTFMPTEAYGPESPTMRARSAVRRPSASHPASASMRIGWRFGWSSRDSSR